MNGPGANPLFFGASLVLMAAFVLGQNAAAGAYAALDASGHPAWAWAATAILLLGASAVAWRQQRVEVFGALAIITMASVMTHVTLQRSLWQRESTLVAPLLGALAAGCLATLVLLRCRTGPWALRFIAALMAAAAATSFWPPNLSSADAAAGTSAAEPWVAAVRGQLLAHAAGDQAAGFAACAQAAEHGAEVATLRALCPPPAKGAAHDASEALGQALCLAVAHPLPEAGADKLRCIADVAQSDDARAHRCRVAGELYAEAGALGFASAALGEGGGPGKRLGQALWQERGLGVPGGLQHHRNSVLLAWPQANTIGPKQLGFILLDVPGTLLWHPGGPGRLGALWASSPYRGALRTEVPLPTGCGAPHAASVVIRGHGDLAITLHSAERSRRYSCPSTASALRGDAALPVGACQGAWAAAHLEGDAGHGIDAAYIHGPFMLSQWQWHTRADSGQPL